MMGKMMKRETVMLMGLGSSMDIGVTLALDIGSRS